jgi:hypothetical protein
LKKHLFHKISLLAAVLCVSASMWAQRNPGEVLRNIGNKIPGAGGQSGSSGGDSVIARNRFEDSITVTIYYLDSTRGTKLDSNINDFTRRYPIPATHIYLGNTGTATRSILFAPALRSGFDPGFHAFDVYKWKLEKVRFYNTTRPYTELGYVLGSRAEQLIDIVHTQNIRPYWNFSINYRLINAPGFFRNQKTNHNNYLFTSWYQSRSKRYNNYFIILQNALQSGENGGIRTDKNYLEDIIYAKDRFLIPSKIGGSPEYGTDFFSNAINTGNRYTEFNILMRQQYDLGKKDSIVTDSTVIPLFYPRLRFEHTFKYGNYKYQFKDVISFDQRGPNIPDTQFYYMPNYGIPLPKNGAIYFRDYWKEISNDFSIYQYPDAKNLQQFIKLGIELQLLKGNFFKDSVHTPSASLYNLMGHGEYRNRTKNQKWDMLAFGRLHLNGYNLGDYHAYVSLQRLLGQRIGSLQVGFENVNRKHSFIYDERSAFYLDVPKDFNKENTVHLFASIIQPRLRLQLSADYYLISNYLYITEFRRLRQEGTLFNVLRINALKTFKIGRRWNWYAELYVQQKTGGAQLNIPAIFTRHRFLYEGTLGFPNLNIAMGVEARYHTPYEADNYSPVLGQFFYQNAVTISNLPDIAAMLHFRIRSFRAYIRAENLNTARLFGGFQFNNNNLAAPDYPTPGLILRLGIYWSFVN